MSYGDNRGDGETCKVLNYILDMVIFNINV